MASQRKGLAVRLAERFARRRGALSPAPSAPAPPEFPPRIETPWDSYPELRSMRGALDRGDWPALRETLAALPSDNSRVYALRELDDLEELDPLLEKALTADPTDLDALALTAARTVAKGWAVRGGGLANTVGRDQFEVFHEHLQRADAMFRDVVTRDPANLCAGSNRILTAQALSMGLNEVMRRYEQTAAHHPHAYRLQAIALNANYPKWSGSWESAYEFARRAATAAPAGSVVPTLVLDYHVEKHIAESMEADEPLKEYYTRPEVVSDITAAADQSVLHPAYRKELGWVAVCNRYAQALAGGGDWPRVARVYDMLENRMDTDEWTRFLYPENVFCLYRDKGPNPTGHTS